MADWIDRAVAQEETELTAILDSARARHARRKAGPGRDECQDCGDPISARRLAAVPWATRCTECEQLAERAG